MRALTTGFADIDAQDDPTFYIRYLDHVSTLPAIVQARDAAIAFLRPLALHDVIDCGCGTGSMTAALAELVGTTGSVTGVDRSRVLIDEAIRRHGALENVSFRQGDLLDLPQLTFDAAWLDRVLAHVPDVKATFLRVAASLRKGGVLVSIEPDWETMVMCGIEEDLYRRWLSDVTHNQVWGTVGRALPGLFRTNGIQIDVIAPFTLVMPTFTSFTDVWNINRMTRNAERHGALRPGEGESFIAQAREADASGSFFSMATFLTVIGTRKELVS